MAKYTTHRLERNLFLLFIFFLAVAFFLGYTIQLNICHDSSIYCQIKRGALVGLQWSIFWGVRYGITSKTYALAFLFSLAGAAASLFQAKLFVCINTEASQKQIWGFSPYSWTTFLFVVSILFIAALLMMHKPQDPPIPYRMRLFEKITFTIICSTSILFLYSLINCDYSLA